MAFSITAQELILALKGTAERCYVKLFDEDGVAVDADAISISLQTLGSSVIASDDGLPTTRIEHPATGVYYFPIGDQTVVANVETATARELLLVWHIEVDGEAENIVQSIKVITPYVLDLIGSLRRQIDKARMMVDEDPDNPSFLGYTDKDLIEYLEGGLTIWNMYEPYPTFLGLEDFPRMYKQGLIDAALVVGIQSQELFAISTDIPNYSAQGAAFVINHQPALAAFTTRLAQRLDKQIPIAKLKFVRSGSVMTAMGPNMRLQMLVDASPQGALLRNLYVSGGGG